eukprot:GHVT01060948.1.p3 GENE.GHVT01060948.1~~GHVT01060948.1.p3  ORF type:complete len:100 (-),score=10.35 GHVT01060948.1:536-835(-)
MVNRHIRRHQKASWLSLLGALVDDAAELRQRCFPRRILRPTSPLSKRKTISPRSRGGPLSRGSLEISWAQRITPLPPPTWSRPSPPSPPQGGEYRRYPT